MTTRLRVASAFVIVAALATSAIAAERCMLPRGRTLPGLKFEGETIPDDVAKGDDAKMNAWIAARVAAALDRNVDVFSAGSSQTVSLRDLIAPIDVPALAAQVRSFGRYGTLGTRLDLAMRARKGEIDLPLQLTVDVVAAERIVAALKGKVDDVATDAKLDLAAHTVVQDHAGRLLEFDGAVVKLSSEVVKRAHVSPLTMQKGESLDAIELPSMRINAKITADALAKLDISTVVGTFETHFGRGGDQAPRAVNIETAARKLDGLVLQPGALMSFNDVVGERSEANGFKVAWEIFKGEMRPGVGGGTCQVASTFHAAAFFAGFDVLERLPHSRPSAYITMGLDSTVVYPVVDLKLKNPHPFAVVVHTKVAANTLTVELLGKEKPVSVVFARDVVDVFPYQRKIEEDPGVKPGHAIKKQGGIRGYRVRRTRKVTPVVGEPRVETTYDFYPPTTEIYRVAPGTDPNDLPAMPQDVLDMIAKKNGDLPPTPAATDAVACAGDCASAPKPTIEVINGAGVHAPTGDQANPNKSVSIAH